MTDTPLDRLSQTGQRTAADVERIASTLSALHARVANLEEQLAAANAARISIAERVEGLRSGLFRLDRYEKGLIEMRSEFGALAGEVERKSGAAVKDVAASWQRDAERFGRQLDELGHRLDSLENERRRDDTPKRLDGLIRAHAELAVKLDRLADRVGVLENASPRTDPAVTARLEAADAGFAALRRDFDDWQRRIEQQTEVVREARSVAESMRENVTAIERAHHATAEAQRIAETRTAEALAGLRDEASERWARFSTERGHAWDAVARESADRDRRIEALDERGAAEAARLVALEHALAEELRLRDQAAEAARRDLLRALDVLRSAADGMRSAVEDGLPADEHAAVVDERKAAERRAFRAQRASRSD